MHVFTPVAGMEPVRSAVTVTPAVDGTKASSWLGGTAPFPARSSFTVAVVPVGKGERVWAAYSPSVQWVTESWGMVPLAAVQMQNAEICKKGDDWDRMNKNCC
jgi:hypothetical protein